MRNETGGITVVCMETGGIIVVCMEKKAEGSSSIPASLRHGGTLTRLLMSANAEQAMPPGPGNGKLRNGVMVYMKAIAFSLL